MTKLKLVEVTYKIIGNIVMQEEGYLWVVFSPQQGGYEFDNRNIIKSSYRNIVGKCGRWDNGSEYIPHGVILTQCQELDFESDFPIRIIPIVTEQPSNQPLHGVEVLQVGTKVIDINENSFTVIKADKMEESDDSFFMPQKLTIEYKKYNVSVF